MGLHPVSYPSQISLFSTSALQAIRAECQTSSAADEETGGVPVEANLIRAQSDSVALGQWACQTPRARLLVRLPHVVIDPTRRLL